MLCIEGLSTVGHCSSGIPTLALLKGRDIKNFLGFNTGQNPVASFSGHQRSMAILMKAFSVFLWSVVLFDLET